MKSQITQWDELDSSVWKVEITKSDILHAILRFTRGEKKIFDKLSKSGNLAEGLLALTMLVQKIEQMNMEKPTTPLLNFFPHTPPK